MHPLRSVRPQLQAFFHAPTTGGRRLYLHHQPAAHQPVRAALLYLHPWGEEMNKSRRMAAMTSRALAAQGDAVLQIDLAGCGDSSGEFADASWGQWLADVLEAAAWLRAQHPHTPLWLWGHRAGALLAAQAAQAMAQAPGPAQPVNLLLWQPVQQGKALLQQFLRLKAAAQLADGGGKAILDAARTDLAAGRAIEVAGYTLSPALADGLAQASLVPSPLSAHPNPTTPVAEPQASAAAAAGAARLAWLEVSAQDPPSLSPAAQTALPRWQAAGWQVTSACVAGPAFWQTTEIEDAPALCAATLQQLQAARA